MAKRGNPSDDQQEPRASVHADDRHYTNGDALKLEAVVVDDHDTGNVVVEVGGQRLSLSRAQLRAAEVGLDRTPRDETERA